MSKLTPWLAAPLLFLIATAVYAFKVDTHVWVGQQVINDLEDDGMLTFQLGNKDVRIAIDADVKNAILGNKNEFLIGNLGPDATPDAVVGQTVIHPGIKDDRGKNIGWQTNDWLEYMLANTGYSERAKSFVYGYLSHAAADIFSHTYINQYAGDIFDLTDETLVEQRHFILESYLAKLTPPLKDSYGQAVGAPWQAIHLDDHYAEFVRDTLIYNDAVQNEYRKVPYASHLVAFYDFRKGVDQLAEAGIWHEIDVAVTQIVAAYFDIVLTPEEADKIVNEAQRVIDKLNSGADDVQAYSDALYLRLSKYDSQLFSRLTSSVNAMQDAERSWLDNHQAWRRKLAELIDPPNCPKIPVPDIKCKWYGCFPTVRWVDDAKCNLDRKAIIATNNAILDVADALEQKALNLKNDLIDKTIEVRAEGTKAADSVVKVTNALFDLQQTIGADVSPTQAVLRGWRSDIDLAMTAYIKAVTQTMVNTMNPDASNLEPIENWFGCYHLQLIGVPSSVSNCEFRDSLTQVKQSIENIILIIDEATSVGAQVGLPSTRDLIELRDNSIDQLVDKLKQKVSDKIADALPPEIRELIEMLGVNVTDDILNDYFTRPETTTTPKGLLKIPDLADRIKAEMHLTSGSFDPQRYAVAYDAVVLAKMALLNASEFEQLALASQSRDYLQYMGGLNNAVAQAFESLDGNHQWMATPPPRPNTLDYYPPVTYTYASSKGFIPWQGDMRDKLFRKLFIGPLSPGVDAPSTIGMPNIVGTAYPYKVSAADPFPDGIQNSCDSVTCGADMPVGHFVTTRQLCDSCHPTGEWTTTPTYTHVGGNYPGNHRAYFKCTDCHTSNSETISWLYPVYAPTCGGCHYGEGVRAHRNGYLGNEGDCAGSRCHSVSDRRW